MTPPLLAMRGIGKAYGPVRALDDVSLDLERGEVLGIVGENGAGKSTLMKILGGAEASDAGTIALDGEPLRLAHTRTALDADIVVIYQELGLVPERSVAEIRISTIFRVTPRASSAASGSQPTPQPCSRASARAPIPTTRATFTARRIAAGRNSSRAHP